jgi:hypothetical protein
LHRLALQGGGFLAQAAREASRGAMRPSSSVSGQALEPVTVGAGPMPDLLNEALAPDLSDQAKFSGL